MSREPERTLHAQQAMDLTELFAFKFATRRFGSRTAYRLELRRPDGPSTAGGRLARQPLLLTCEEPARRGLALGWIDTAQRRAEVKPLAALDELHRQRYHAGLDLEVDEHQRIVRELEGFLRFQKIEVVVAAPAARPVPPPPDKISGDVPRIPGLSLESLEAIPWRLAAIFGGGLFVGLTLGYLMFAA